MGRPGKCRANLPLKLITFLGQLLSCGIKNHKNVHFFSYSNSIHSWKLVSRIMLLILKYFRLKFCGVFFAVGSIRKDGCETGDI